MQSLVEASKLHCLGRGVYLAFSRDACIVERQMTWRTTFLSKKVNEPLLRNQIWRRFT